MDLTDLSNVTGTELTDEQLRGILSQIDLNITNLLRDGKLAALKYKDAGDTGRTADRAVNLDALLAARETYQRILSSRPAWRLTIARDE